jgi:tetratricopeptide (TPR) repeat protein
MHSFARGFSLRALTGAVALAASVHMRAEPMHAAVTPRRDGIAPEVAATLDRGIEHLHNLDFAQAEACFASVAARAADQPVGDVYLACAALWRGVAEGMNSGITARFEHHVNLAAQRGFEFLGREYDPWQRFYLGAAFVLRGCAEGRRGEYISALQWLKRGIVEIDALRDDPQVGADACAILGACEYFTAYAPWYVRVIASLLLVPADARQGLEHLERAAAQARFVRTEAALLLAAAYMWERETDRALDISATLEARYPGNHLLWTLQQEILLRDARVGAAFTIATNQIERISGDPRVDVHGLLPDQQYMLGRIELARGNYPRALTHFSYAERIARDKPYVRAWALLRQGTIYDLLNRTDEARACYTAVERVGPVSPLVKEYARQFIRVPYQGAPLE